MTPRLLIFALALTFAPTLQAEEQGWFTKVADSVGHFVTMANATAPRSPQTLDAKGTIEVAFSPRGNVTELVTDTIDKAQKRIWVEAYSFTSKPIMEALHRAHKRGVKIIVIADKSQKKSEYSGVVFTANVGIKTYINDQYSIFHNKVMIIDEDTLITGSFNFSQSAEKSNAENLLVMRGNRELVKIYEQNFRFHQAQSTELKPHY